MKQATFNHAAYTVRDLEEAKIVTVGDLGSSEKDIYTASAERWIFDTEYTLDMLFEHFPIDSKTFLLDYGCGTGRISKGLIEARGCEIVGCDASETMRGVAQRYVGNQQRFHTCSPEGMDKLTERFDCAYTLWVLQHSPHPDLDVKRIYGSLKPGARLFVLNEIIRFVPTIEYGFVNDGLDIQQCLRDVFGEPVAEGKLDPTKVHPEFSRRTWWAIYQKK